MQLVDDHGHDGTNTLLDLLGNVVQCLLIIHFQFEFVLNFLHRLIRFQGDIGNVRIDHQREQVENQIGMPPQVCKRGSYKNAKLSEILRTHSAHCVDHFSGYLHGWWTHFGITTQNETKIDVEQATSFGHEQIVQVAITNAQQIGYDTVTS